ncbi:MULTISPECIES: LysR family transcriptional regulator [unclassified Halomonas]|uniref:LysR family transcriptional regulator n=1 Tax=unclassified Halomonas TaxID=2609666 RepID=UPI001CF376C7|nr:MULTISPECIES: LysR family transcriptional regulator [unclassified Halomonas]MCA8863974.1 LysR family transcriptional regulator [Halomonas sp. SBBP1]UZH11220.1 LysR family transcriptional regulator [Halomonas sp. BDJS001]
MDRLSDIALFLRVVDLGTISAAARSLDLSVAVASQRLQRLEKGLNVRLLHRTTRRLHPTPEGLALAEQGRELVEGLEALTQDLRGSADNVTGTLRVTLPHSFGRQYISPLLPEFLNRYPRLDLCVGLTDQVVDLVGEGYDLGIRIGILEDSSLVARRLADDERVLCASPDYLKRHGTPQRPGELADHQCLVLSSSRRRQDIWHLTDNQGQSEAIQVGGRIRSNQGEMLTEAVLGGQGIAQHSVWHIHEYLRNGQLSVVLPDYRLTETGIYAVMPQRQLVPPRVRAFVAFLEERLAEHPVWALRREKQ